LSNGPLNLWAGPLALAFDPSSGWLRHVRLGDREVLRAVYPAVRDRFWNTLPNAVSDLTVEEAGGGFRLGFNAECRRGPIHFAFRGEVAGTADGTVTYWFDGEARGTFLRNRIGLCVLHPIACAGRPCTIEHPDGTVEASRFPTEIAPHQPFLEVRALAHEVAPGLSAEVRFEGDGFETEDQRNWTDMSFKTYSTPLRLPFPVEVAEGTKVRQAVTLRLRGRLPSDAASVPAETRPLSVRLGGKTVARLPRLGLGIAGHGRPLAPREIDRLKALRPAHLRVDLELGDAGAPAALERAAAEARALGAVLEIALLLGDAPREEDLEALLREAERVRLPVGAWLVLHGRKDMVSADGMRLARQRLHRCDPAARIGTGTNLYFVYLNRQPPPLDDADLLCYSLNPQVHAFDDESIVETLEGQTATAEAARRLAGGRPVAVTPITLRPRFNPHGSDPDEPPATADSRQASLLAAAWTLASVRRLAGAGVESLTYFETTGERGVMEAAGGAVFPVYHALADLAELAGAPVDLCACSHPLQVEALSAGGKMLVANLTPRPQRVTLDLGEWGAARYRVRYLDETTAADAAHAPESFRADAGPLLERPELHLGPYAVARIAWEGLR
jgi:hypothetical protein